MRLLAKNFFIATLSLLLFLPSLSHSQAEKPQGNIDYIFVVDLSSSMKQSGLFDKLKKSLEGYIASLQIGDRAIIYGFDSDVKIIEDIQITNAAQKDEIIKNIRRLEANGKWTYLTKAIDLLGKRLADLQQARDRYKQVYILTDGKNDPPPDVKDDLSRLIQVGQLIERYKGIFEQKDTFIYFIYFGKIDPTTVAEISKISDNIKVQECSKDVRVPIPPSIKIAPDRISLGELLYAENIEKEISFEVANIQLQGVSEIELKAFALDPPDAAVKLECSPVALKLAGQKFSAKLSLSKGAPKAYELNVRPVLSDPKATMTPKTIPLSFTIIQPPPPTTTTSVKLDPEVVLTPASVQLGTIPIHKAGEKAFKITLSGLNNADPSVALAISFTLSPEGNASQLSPSLKAGSGAMTAVGQEFAATLKIAAPKAGDYTFKIIPKVNGATAMIKPAAIPVTCSIIEPKFSVTTSDLGKMRQGDAQDLKIVISTDKAFADKKCTIDFAPADAWKEYLGFDPKKGDFTVDANGSAAFTTKVKALKALPWLKKAEFKIIIDDPQEFGGGISGAMPVGVKVAFLVLLLLIIAALGVFAYGKTRPTPSKDRYLIYLDSNNLENENGSWNLFNEQKKKFLSNTLSVSGDLRVSSFREGSFFIVIKKDGDYLKSNSLVTIQGKEEDPINAKSGYRLNLDEIFYVDGKPFKYSAQ